MLVSRPGHGDDPFNPVASAKPTKIDTWHTPSAFALVSRTCVCVRACVRGGGGGGGGGGGISEPHHCNIISAVKERCEGLEELCRHLVISIQDADDLVGRDPLVSWDEGFVDLQATKPKSHYHLQAMFESNFDLPGRAWQHR